MKDWEKFKHRFHESWWYKMKPFIESEVCDKIYDQIREQTKRGKRVLPESEYTFRCFKETPLDQMKVCILGLSPYHTLKDRIPIADGLLMSASRTRHIPPSLDQFYGAMEREVYKDHELGIFRNPDLSYLAHRGVLMFNASLTTEILKAGSHLKIWEPFTKYIFEEVLAPSGVPIIYLGLEAAKFSRYAGPLQWEFKISHPAFASRSGEKWSSEGMFKNVNKILKDSNNEHIEWGEILPF